MDNSAQNDIVTKPSPVKRVLLIYPPTRITAESLKFCQLPLGVSYLAAYIRDRFEVGVLDATAEGYHHEEPEGNGFFRYGLSLEDIAGRIRRFNPDAVGISTPFSQTYPVVEDIAAVVKQIDNQITTIVGGNHPTFLAEECLTRPGGRYIDYIICGEGEESFRSLLIALGERTSVNSIDGLAFRDGKKLVVNPKKSTIQDVDRIPFPARDLMPMDLYAKINVPHIIFSKHKANTSLFTGRGCPARCTFCSSSVFWGIQGRLRNRSVDNVLDEIGDCIERFGINEFNIEDDNFTADIPRAKAILQGIIDRGYKIRWNTPNGLAVWTFDEELIRLMKDSGVREIVLAFESGSDDVLRKIMHKPLKLDAAVRNVKLVQKYNIRHNAFFMIGLPGETMGQIHQTIEFAKKLRLEAANLFAFFPLPGTAAYRTCVERNYIEKDFDFTQNSSTLGRITTEEFTADQITSLVRKNWTLQYLRPLLSHPFAFFTRYGYLLLNPGFLREIIRRVVNRLVT